MWTLMMALVVSSVACSPPHKTCVAEFYARLAGSGSCCEGQLRAREGVGTRVLSLGTSAGRRCR